MEIICPSTLIPGSKVLFVGESPGREECAEKRGFVGPAGRVLQRAAQLAGLDWTQCSLSNVVKRPPDGGFSSDHFRRTFYATQEIPIITKAGKVSKKVRRVTAPTPEYRAWVQDLCKDVLQVSPAVVVAVGAEALKALCGLDQIHCWRGSVIESTLVPGQKVIPIVHPSYMQRGQWSDFWPMVYDLKNKVRVEMEFPEIRREPWTAVYPTSINEVIDFLRAIKGRWSLDIETRGGSIACIGVGCNFGSNEWGSTTGLCIPIQTTRGPFWSASGEQKVWQELSALFSTNPALVGQNLVYDLDWLQDYNIRASGVLMDTMTAHCFLYPEWAQGYKGLDFITSFYLGDVPYYKGDGKTWGSKTPDEDTWRYNLKDVAHTLRASYPIEEQLRARNLWDRYQQEIIPLTYLALEMQERKLQINESIKHVLDTCLQREIISIHDTLRSTCGTEINTGSSKQVGALLYETLRLPIRRSKGSGQITTDENALRELRTLCAHPVLDLIIKERHLRKRKESFIDCELEEIQ